MAGTALGLVGGYALDALLGDPRSGHPVALFGKAAAAVERRGWADSRGRGVMFTGICVGAAAGLGVVLRAVTARSGTEFVVTAIGTWLVLGGRSLAEEGAAMSALLDARDIPGARERLAHLCGRDARELDGPELARAATESIAENTSDAVIAPLFWGAVGGLPLLFGYRALNTLDAMVGHRSARYARFGWASARADDIANLIPARLAALLTAAGAPLVGGSTGEALRVWLRDGARHPSPNAGQVEAAFAGALNVRLGGMNSYAGQMEDRGPLGDGRAPDTAALADAVTLSRVVGLLALAFAVAVAG